MTLWADGYCESSLETTSVVLRVTVPRLAVKRPVVIGDASWSNAETVVRLRLQSILTFNLSSLHMHLYGSNSYQ